MNETQEDFISRQKECLHQVPKSPKVLEINPVIRPIIV